MLSFQINIIKLLYTFLFIPESTSKKIITHKTIVITSGLIAKSDLLKAKFFRKVTLSIFYKN